MCATPIPCCPPPNTHSLFPPNPYCLQHVLPATAVPRRYTGIHIGPPCLEEEYRQEEITPQQCRLRDITYAGG